MSAQDTAEHPLEPNLERVFAHIQSPDWLERVGSLYMVNLRTQTPEVQQIYALYSEARELEANQPQQGLHLCELARERSLEIAYAPGLAWYWRETGSIQQTLGEMPNAEKAMHNAIQAFTALEIRVGVASSLNILGHVLAVNGRLEESISNYREYVRIARELGRRESEAIGLANIAETHLDLGQPWQALEVLLESKRVLQELHFNPSASAWVLGLIGRAYHDLGDGERALTCLLETLDLNRASQDQHGEVGTLTMVAKIHRINGDLETANGSLNKALRLNELHGDQSQRTHLLIAQAELQRLQRKLTQAKQSASQALEVALENNNRIGEVNARIEFAALEPESEITHLKHALEISEEIQTRGHSARIHGLLCAAHERSGRASLALEHLHAQRQIEQVLQRAETEHRIRNLSIQFEIGEAERETQHERQRSQTLEAANLENTRLLEALRVQTEQLERLANQDALTGLANRRTLEHLLPRELERARRYAHPISVAFADIDHFKRVNDRFGHAIGDQVLKRIAQIFLEHCRSMDVIARFGGEEFVLVLPETTLEGAIQLCERIRTKIQTHDWNSIRPGLEITMSFGVNADTDLDTLGMLDAADTQLYSAKQRGRNRVAWNVA
jgi:diguanylate cyclase (GGDEF)-like protein